MGVVVKAYSNLKPTKYLYPAILENVDDDEFYETYILAFAYKGFEHSYAGLADLDRLFSFSGTSDPNMIGGRYYTKTSQTKNYEIMDTSYGGYNQWRELLAESQNINLPKLWKNPDPTTPFYEVLKFADNEGTIGPVAAAELYDDFISKGNKKRYVDYITGVNLFNTNELLDYYDSWITGLELACQGGLIQYR